MQIHEWNVHISWKAQRNASRLLFLLTVASSWLFGRRMLGLGTGAAWTGKIWRASDTRMFRYVVCCLLAVEVANVQFSSAYSLCPGTWQIICCMCNEVVTKYDLQPQEQTNESFLYLKWQWNYGCELTDQKNVSRSRICYNLICGFTKFVVTMDGWMEHEV